MVFLIPTPAGAPRLGGVTDTVFDALRSYIDSTTDVPDALAEARRDAEEFGLPVPDEATGQLLSTLAAAGASGKSAGAVAVTPAVGVVGLHLLHGLGERGTLTCIDPEVVHQKQAKRVFRAAGFSPSRVRFLPSRPLDVMGRLAADSSQLVYVDVPAIELSAVVRAAWPLLCEGGTLVLADALLDETRTDRETIAAREAETLVREIEDAVITRLPLGGGLVLATRR